MGCTSDCQIHALFLTISDVWRQTIASAPTSREALVNVPSW
jgi:hypothetical protein